MEHPRRSRRRRKRDKDYPRRKLSAYNLFFRDERKAILQENGYTINAEDDHDEFDENPHQDEAEVADKMSVKNDTLPDDGDSLVPAPANSSAKDSELTSISKPHGSPLTAKSSLNSALETSISSNNDVKNDLGRGTVAGKAVSLSSSSVSAFEVAARPKIAFQDLARTIGARWKRLDPERLKYYQDLAAKESERFDAEMKVYQEKHQQKRMQILQGQEDAMFHHNASLHSSSHPYVPLQGASLGSSLWTLSGEVGTNGSNQEQLQQLHPQQQQQQQQQQYDGNMSAHALFSNPNILSGILNTIPNSEEERIALIFKLHQFNQLVEQHSRELQSQLATALQQQQLLLLQQQQPQSIPPETAQQLLSALLLSQPQQQMHQHQQQQQQEEEAKLQELLMLMQQQQQQQQMQGATSSPHHPNLHPHPSSYFQNPIVLQQDTNRSASHSQHGQNHNIQQHEQEQQSQDANLLCMLSQQYQGQPQEQSLAGQQNHNVSIDAADVLQLQRELANCSPSQKQQLLELFLERQR
jgi:hypothetical protein